MWDTVYPQCQLLSPSQASEDRAFALVTLCITCKGYIPKTDREQVLSKLVCDTIQSLNTTKTHIAAVPEDQVRLALKKGVFDKAETFARFLWANTISQQRGSAGKGSFPTSKLLIDVCRGCGILYNDQLKNIFRILHRYAVQQKLQQTPGLARTNSRTHRYRFISC